MGELPQRLVSFNQLVAYNTGFYRRKLGLSQEEWGAPLGWSGPSVSAAERSWDGKRPRKFDADEVAALADRAGVPILAFFMPPEDADTKVRYVVEIRGSLVNIAHLLPQLIAMYPYRDDSPAMAAFRDRLMALGSTSYASDPVVEILLQRAADEGRELLTQSRRQAEIVTNLSRVHAESLVRDMQERHRQAMGNLVQTRVELERRIDDLRAFEREYRARLLAYLKGQVRDLEAGARDSGVFPEVAVTAPPPTAGPEDKRSIYPQEPEET